MVGNRDAGKIYIKKRPLPEWLTYYVFLAPFINGFITDILSLPSVLKYLVDAAWLMLMLIIFVRRSIVLKKDLFPVLVFIVSLLLYDAVVYVVNYQSVFYFLWGFRNMFRAYAAYIAYVTFFDEEDVYSCFKMADALFWINFAVTLYQFFVVGLKQDYLGGIFGTDRGCNGYSILFFAIVLTRSLLLYMEEKEKPTSCFLKCGVALIVASMAELKILFLIFVYILVFAAVLTRFSWRKVFLFVGSAFLLFFTKFCNFY